jgi:hypothetical protein
MIICMAIVISYLLLYGLFSATDDDDDDEDENTL